MRVAIITEGYLPEMSGVTTSLYQRLRWLAEWGHIVRLYAPDYSGAADLYPHYRDHVGEVMPGVTVVPYPSRPYVVDFARDPKPFTFGKVAYDVERFSPDVVHAECPERLFMGFRCRAGVGLAHRLKVPATAFYHTNYLDLIGDYKATVPSLRIPGVVWALRRLMVWVYNSYDATMVSTNVVCEKVKGFGIRNTVLRPFLGVDTDRFQPRPAEPREPGSPLTVLYLGRLSPDKEIALLLEAFDRMRGRVGNVRFVIAGGGPEEVRVKQWADQHGDATFVGRIPNEQAPCYYAQADIFATACSKESFGLTVLEAMACGTPAVGARAGGVAEVVDDGKTGLLFPPGDAAGFAGALVKLATDEKLRAGIRCEALAAARQRTWARGAQEMLSVWEGLRSARIE